MTIGGAQGASWFRWSVIAAALLLAVLAVGDYRSRRQVQERLESLMAIGGATRRSPEATADVRNEPDSSRAELRAARLLIADELDQAWRAELSPAARLEQRESSRERLAAIREIATRNLEAHPASWQAAMILGAARYLESVRSGEPSGALARSAWEAPLILAERLGPGKPEPTRFLAAAALSDWPRLGAAGREQAIAVLGRAFDDPETLELLLEPWMRIAPSESVALDAVPDRVRTWVLLESYYSRDNDWERFAATRRRRIDAQERELEQRVSQAERRLAGGDSVGARSLLLDVLADLNPDKRHAPILEKVMALLPAGSLGEWRRRRLRAWLVWARERCLLEECLLSAPSIRRISGAVSLPGLHEQAAAAMMAGDVDRARALADRASTTLLPEWGPYLLLATRHFASAGEPERARSTLQKVHRSWQSSAGYRAAARSLARTAAQDPDNPPTERLLQWSAGDWRRETSAHRLDIETAGTCASLRLEVSSSGDGSAVEARWNGKAIDWFSVDSRTRHRIECRIPPGFNVLEIRSIGGERVAPGRVDLLDCGA